MAIIIDVTKTKAMIRRVYNFNEHAVWHSILSGDVKNDFVSENMLALSTFGIYHWQKGTDYAWIKNENNYLLQWVTLTASYLNQSNWRYKESFTAMWETVWSTKGRCNTLLCNYFRCRLLLDVINGFSITSFFY